MARNHHYVPKCYLKGFIDPTPNPRFPDDDEPRVWQAELKSQRIRLRPTHKVGSSPGFYALGSDSEDINEAAERAHGKLESAVAPTLQRLNKGDFNMEAEEWENLLVFASTLAMRGPSTRNILDRTRQNGHRILLSMLADIPTDQFIRELETTYPNESFTPERAREIQEWAKAHPDYKFKIPPHKWIKTSMKTALEGIFPLFYQMNWTYLHAPTAHFFICSDNPVSQVDPTVPRNSRRGHGLVARDIEVCLPLGRSLALLGHWEPAPGHLYLTSELVEQINLRSVEQARVEILGPTRKSVEWGLALREPQAP